MYAPPPRPSSRLLPIFVCPRGAAKVTTYTLWRDETPVPLLLYPQTYNVLLLLQRNHYYICTTVNILSPVLKWTRHAIPPEEAESPVLVVSRRFHAVDVAKKNLLARSLARLHAARLELERGGVGFECVV